MRDKIIKSAPEVNMKLVMVGGHTRNVGKTSVIEGIIKALPECNWTAVKITQFGHNECSASGRGCKCSVSEHSFAISNEPLNDSGTDTSRFLRAGARRALWVRTKQGELESAIPALRQNIEGDRYVIVESNSLRRFWNPALYLQVIDPLNSDCKLSSQEFFDLSDAYLIIRPSHYEGRSDQPFSQNVLLAREIRKDKPCFQVRPEDSFISPGVIEFVRSRL